MTDTTYSTKNATQQPASVEKRRTLYLAASDPRAQTLTSKGAISAFEQRHYAEVKILSDSDYIELLKHQVGIEFTGSGDPESVDPSVPGDPIDDPIVSTLHPPTMLWWDALDPNAIVYGTANSSPKIDIAITFDPAIDDVTTDGEISYYAVAVPTTIGAADTSNSSAAKTFAPVTGVTVGTHNSTTITVSWVNLANATGYSINVAGNNQPSQGNALSKDWHSNPTPNAARHSFTIKPATGKSFTGSYVFTIYATYTNGTSKAVTQTVTI